jgi:ATP-dependent DNA helicase RecQ
MAFGSVHIGSGFRPVAPVAGKFRAFGAGTGLASGRLMKTRSPSTLSAAVRRTLRHTFGIDRLRRGQEEVIARALARKDTLAVMPTGAGKSLCYQVPALHLDGTTVVISPLIALMKDQVEKLEEAGIPAEQFNSALSRPDQDAALDRVAAGRSGIVFATPERLADPAFVGLLKARRIALFVVDEAHCISQWGHDFRPAFLEIGAAVKALGNPPLLALTATAPGKVVDDIRRQFERPGLHVVDTGLYRPNLRLQVAQCVRDGEKLERTESSIRRPSRPVRNCTPNWLPAASR